MKMHSKPVKIIIENLQDQGLAVEVEMPNYDPHKQTLPVTNKKCIDALAQEASDLIGKHLQKNDDTHAPEEILKNSEDYLKGLGEQLEDHLKGLGEQLFEYLCLNIIRERLKSLLKDRLDTEEYLWLQFRIRSPELEDWPLELLYDDIFKTKESEAEIPPFLALSPKVLSTRYREQEDEIPEREQLEKPKNLRVLLVVANPKDNEISNLQDKLDVFRLPGPATFELKILENPPPVTCFRLGQCLYEADKAKKPFHIIYFLGHGYIDKNTLSTGLILEKEDGTSDRIPSEKITKLLKRGTEQVIYPKLVVLNACHSADGILSVASDLVDQGVPAVVGMRSEVSVSFALLFVQFFHGLLRSKEPIEWAITKTRIDIYREWKERILLDWCSPVVYLRTEDGRLFDFETDSNEWKIWSEQLDKLHELASENVEQATQAMEDLLKLGASALALTVAAILAYPLASVRARAAQLLVRILEQERERAERDDIYRRLGRLQPNTKEFDNALSRLIGSALVYEPDLNVRQAMTNILVQLNTSIGFQYLADFANELQAKIPQVATQLNELAIRLREHADRLEQLNSLIGQSMNPTQTQLLYTERLSIALSTTRKLREYLDQIRSKTMTPEQIQYEIDGIISGYVRVAKQTIDVCNNAFKSSESLIISLDTGLAGLGKGLETEIEQIKKLEDELEKIRGMRITDPSGQATIRLT